MDRTELMGLLEALAELTLKVDVEGLLYDVDDNNHSPEDVEAAIDDLEEELNELRKVLAWAKSAPKRTPAEAK
jgi:hypothetical protein